ncbi:hypothetical protein LFL96_20490 [Paraburkholderia sp. D15]|uniref:hypothetical protein n=1 Tax=Paraburkholderia sp. D15 TaxID=2880218 RepID=UPI002478D07B|nr:hypothetical protein [Paraburkholderia sp. D15]WGS53443.1 hypothetical protein LFL96_20490 [Paraburkholderia sp. D15]
MDFSFKKHGGNPAAERARVPCRRTRGDARADTQGLRAGRKWNHEGGVRTTDHYARPYYRRSTTPLVWRAAIDLIDL